MYETWCVSQPVSLPNAAAALLLLTSPFSTQFERTPLHHALLKKRMGIETAMLLIELGANMHASDAAGQTGFEYAREMLRSKAGDALRPDVEFFDAFATRFGSGRRPAGAASGGTGLSTPTKLLKDPVTESGIVSPARACMSPAAAAGGAKYVEDDSDRLAKACAVDFRLGDEKDFEIVMESLMKSAKPESQAKLLHMLRTWRETGRLVVPKAAFLKWEMSYDWPLCRLASWRLRPNIATMDAGSTFFHFWALNNGSASIEVARELVAAGLDTDCTDLLGRTPLHVAAMHGSRSPPFAALHLLLEMGANPTARDAAGQTPADYLALLHEGEAAEAATAALLSRAEAPRSTLRLGVPAGRPAAASSDYTAPATPPLPPRTPGTSRRPPKTPRSVAGDGDKSGAASGSPDVTRSAAETSRSSPIRVPRVVTVVMLVVPRQVLSESVPMISVVSLALQASRFVSPTSADLTSALRVSETNSAIAPDGPYKPYAYFGPFNERAAADRVMKLWRKRAMGGRSTCNSPIAMCLASIDAASPVKGGADDATHFKPLVEAGSAWSVSCTGCGASPLVGVAFRCSTCPEGDAAPLCVDCHAKERRRHDATHTWEEWSPVCGQCSVQAPTLRCTDCDDMAICAGCAALAKHDPAHETHAAEELCAGCHDAAPAMRCGKCADFRLCARCFSETDHKPRHDSSWAAWDPTCVVCRREEVSLRCAECPNLRTCSSCIGGERHDGTHSFTALPFVVTKPSLVVQRKQKRDDDDAVSARVPIIGRGTPPRSRARTPTVVGGMGIRTAQGRDDRGTRSPALRKVLFASSP